MPSTTREDRWTHEILSAPSWLGKERGENAVADKVSNDLGWVYRHKPRSDFGIDGEMEGATADGELNARFIGVQVKAGKSYFRQPVPSGWWHRVEPRHLRYWFRSSVPVVVILYDPDSKEAYWQVVDRNYIRRTKSGAHFWCRRSKYSTRRLLQLSPLYSQQRAAASRRAESDVDWMLALDRGKTLLVDIDEEVAPLHKITVRLYEDDEILGQ